METAQPNVDAIRPRLAGSAMTPSSPSSQPTNAPAPTALCDLRTGAGAFPNLEETAVTTNPRRRNGHRRNQLRARVLREETHCAICGDEVDTSLPHGLPESPEVDELLPVSRGGDPLDRDNCRLTHRRCNRQRGAADTEFGKPQRQPVTFITSRDWRP